MCRVSSNIILLLSLLHSCTSTENAGNDIDACEFDFGQQQRMTSRDIDIGEYFEQLKQRFKETKQKCGEICETKMTLENSEKNITEKDFFNLEAIEKAVDCKALFELLEMDPPEKLPLPPRKIPKFLLDDFSLGGRVPIKSVYMNDDGGISHQVVWSKSDINQRIKEFKEGKSRGSYTLEDKINIQRHLRDMMEVQGKHALVIGSQSPWLESLLLSLGASHVTTLEYLDISCDHPQISTMTPRQMSEKFKSGHLPQFDLMVTFSSLEHSGLGRYGDALEPWADRAEMARAFCAMRPGGKALVGVPTGPDLVLFNACRVYGPLQLAQLFANWRLVYTEADVMKYSAECEWCYQPLYLLEK